MSAPVEPQVGEPSATTKASSIKRRPAYSCHACKTRKVRCDRVRPCKACCLRGRPEECVFDVNDDARNALSQLGEIQQLRKEVSRLRTELSQSSSPDSKALTSSASHPESGRRKFLIWQQDALHDELRTSSALTRSTVPFSFVHSLFVERLVDRYAPNLPGSTQWLRFVAAETVEETSSLAMAIHALSIASCGAQDHDRALQMQAHDTYTKVLRQLQRELNSARSSKSAHVLYATMVVSLFELLIRNNALSWLIHLNGLSRLIQHRGPANFMTGLEHETLRFFRMFGLTLCIFTRRPTFLSQPAWKTIPWAKGYPSKDMLDLLLDHIVDIPEMWFQADMIRQGVAAGSLSLKEADAESQQLGSRLADLYTRLEMWKHDWAMTYPGVQEALQTQSSGNCDKSESFRQDRIPQVDYSLSVASCMYYAGKLLLMRALVAFEKLTPQKTLELVELVCEDTEFSLQVVEDYFGALRLLFPLRVAYFSAPEQGPHRPRIQRCLDILATQFQVIFARHLLSSLPGFAGQVQLSTMSTPSPPTEAATSAATSPNPNDAEPGIS